MRCCNCKTDIPPEWQGVFKSNVCPACGDSVMDDTAKQLLDELAEAMEKMPNNALGVASWLFSNYELNKIGEAKPVEKFYGEKPKLEEKQLKIATNPVEEMLKRTNQHRAISETKNKLNDRLTQMAQNIVELDVDNNMYGGNEPPEEDEVEIDGEIPEQEFRSRRGSRALASENSLVDHTVSPPTEDDIEAINELVNQSSDPGPDETLLEIKRQRLNRLKAQEAVTGGGGGFFRRGG